MSKHDRALERCQERMGYRFRDLALLEAAMTHSSSADTRLDSNERMEFLGDSVMGLVVCHHLYERLPTSMEGELTKIKSAVVSRRVCAQVAEKLRLADCLRLGQGIDNGEHLPRSLAAAVLESVIAAIYLDGGLEAAREFILRHMGDVLEEAIESTHQFNYKSQLQQYAQRILNATPHYEMLDEKGPDHSKCFEIAVVIGSQRFPSAWGPSKKEAEQKAAKLALVELDQLKPEPELEALEEYAD
ncbi:MAG: ribonuclease III [Phycisphaerae bacterium]|jgi:ribonuclease-3|nr:ribonuclease III [Phycisphaerae bacterium]MCZ2399598.1 ribonuclease III [Phycisphaerae bacterium]NUQ49939.1 ribonuclease III [Phycisphaerae bacterium]